ncbi:hypothetical protein QOT17_022280, partial [Balamuthia mandrillaris]
LIQHLSLVNYHNNWEGIEDEGVRTLCDCIEAWLGASAMKHQLRVDLIVMLVHHCRQHLVTEGRRRKTLIKVKVGIKHEGQSSIMCSIHNCSYCFGPRVCQTYAAMTIDSMM